MKPKAFLRRLFARFHSEDRGAVTVDWVVLTAAIVSMALGSIHLWRSNVGIVATDIADTTKGYEIKTSFE